MSGMGEARIRREVFWAYVAAFGALWGSLEITLGSFVNAIRLPLSGAMLAAMGAAILVSQRQLLPVRGLSLATGVVAALCKSISPGGIILGPMMGILIEAMAVELVLSTLPRFWFSAALAGALAATCTIVQHVVTLWIYYGGRIIELYIKALEGAGEALGLSAEAGWWALALVALLVASVGALGGGLGRKLGVEAQRILAQRPAEDSPGSGVVDGCV